VFYVSLQKFIKLDNRLSCMHNFDSLHEKLHNSHYSLNIIRIIKSRRMRYAGYIAHMGQVRNALEISIGIPEEKRLLGRITLRWILQN